MASGFKFWKILGPICNLCLNWPHNNVTAIQSISTQNVDNNLKLYDNNWP